MSRRSPLGCSFFRNNTLFLTFIFSFLSLSGCVSVHASKSFGWVEFGHQRFQVEIAQSAREKLRGLQHRTSMSSSHGMLFVYDQEEIERFWMKDTKIPLDMIWIDEDGRVVYIQINAQPCVEDPCPSYGPNLPAKYVLELNAGMVDKIQLHVGDQITINVKE